MELIQNIIFDFDGTVVDTSEGIIKCMQYAFEKLEFESLPDSMIKETIGPPLNEMFSLLLNTQDQELINKGVYYFRDRYQKYGLKELELYSDVANTLSYLSNLNIRLFVVSSKPVEFIKIICEDLGILKYFDDVSGVKLQGESGNKSERIKEIINKYILDKEQTYMIGDRREDILAANENNIKTIGVLYGFGKKKDLESAGCKIFCDSFGDLRNFFA